MCQRGPGSSGNDWVFHILQTYRTGASPSNGLVSDPGHSLFGRLKPLQTCSQRILQPPLTELGTNRRKVSRDRNGHVKNVKHRC